MATRRRPQGNLHWLPGGSVRVTVYGDIDKLIGKRIQLQNRVDEERAPRTEVSVDDPVA